LHHATITYERIYSADAPSQHPAADVQRLFLQLASARQIALRCSFSARWFIEPSVPRASGAQPISSTGHKIRKLNRKLITY
jgi:hypothetical protein